MAGVAISMLATTSGAYLAVARKNLRSSLNRPQGKNSNALDKPVLLEERRLILCLLSFYAALLPSSFK